MNLLDQLADAQMPRPSFLTNWQRPSWLQPQAPAPALDQSQMWNLYNNSMWQGTPSQQHYNSFVQPMVNRGVDPTMIAHRLYTASMG